MIASAVIDSNCLISALIFKGGKSAILRELWQNQSFIPIACKQTILEFLKILHYPKFALSQDEINLVIYDYLPWVKNVVLPATLPELTDLRDPNDAVFIHLTTYAKADALITDDRDILDYGKTHPEVPVVSLGDFIKNY